MFDKFVKNDPVFDPVAAVDQLIKTLGVTAATAQLLFRLKKKGALNPTLQAKLVTMDCLGYDPKLVFSYLYE